MSDKINLKNGDIIQSNRWAEPVEINLLEEVGEYVRLVGVTIHSRGHIDQFSHRTKCIRCRLESSHRV